MITPLKAKKITESSADDVNISRNLSHLMKHYKISFEQLHNNTGIPVTTLKRIKSSTSANPTLNSLLPIANFFGVTLNQLIGIDPLPDSDSLGVYIEQREHWTRIPIIGWEEATQWEKLNDRNVEKKTVYTDIEISDKSFCLQVQEDDWEGFMKDTLLIVDTTLSPKNKSYVIVLKSGQTTASLYQLVIYDGERFLKPPYRDYPPLELDKKFSVIGTVVQMRLDSQ